MKVSTKDNGNYALEVTEKELDLIACALMTYEEATILHLRNMQNAGAKKDDSLALLLRPFYVYRAVDLGRDLAEIIMAAWTEA